MVRGPSLIAHQQSGCKSTTTVIPTCYKLSYREEVRDSEAPSLHVNSYYETRRRRGGEIKFSMNLKEMLCFSYLSLRDKSQVCMYLRICIYAYIYYILYYIYIYIYIYIYLYI